MKFYLFTSSALILTSSCSSFIVSSTPKDMSRTLSRVQMSKSSEEGSSIVHSFGVLAAAAAIILNTGTSASALDSPSNQFVSPVTSSSVQVAEEVKVFDMSLPSYDTISKPKSSADAIKGVEPDPTQKSPAIGAKKKAGGNPFVVTKKPAKKEKSKATAVKTEDAEEKDTKETLKIVDMGMPSYSDNTATKEKSVFAL